MMGHQAWWSVPAAVVLGIPLYSNAAGVIPVVYALMEKKATLGTVLAFISKYDLTTHTMRENSGILKEAVEAMGQMWYTNHRVFPNM